MKHCQEDSSLCYITQFHHCQRWCPRYGRGRGTVKWGNETMTPYGLTYHPTLLDGDVFMGVAGVSHTREALLEIICELDMQRHHNNLMRNANFISRDGTIIDLEYISPI